MVWDAVTGEKLLSLRAVSDPIFWAAWSPDGTRMITVGLTALRVWDAVTGREVLAIPISGISAAFAPNGREIVVDSFVFAIRVFVTSPRLLDARSLDSAAKGGGVAGR